MKAFQYGDVLITLGTGKMDESEECATGLPGEHDYAVITLEETCGKHLFLIKNPWSGGVEGPASAGSIVVRENVDVQNQIGAILSTKEPGAKHSHLEPGTFWMNINEIFQHFDSLYLNWNPGLFSYREDVHFAWDIATSNGLWASFGNNPQYQIHSEAGGTVWIVLSRHFKSYRQASSDANIDSSTANPFDKGFISLYLFRNRGYKVYFTDNSTVRGPYVDSPNTLVKTDLPAGVPCTVVVSEQELLRSSHSFTLSAFSLQPLILSEARDRYLCHTVQAGAWTPANAGGNASSPTYSKNPQFSMNLTRPSDVSLLLELRGGEFPVHVKLVWSDGKPVRFIGTRDIVGDSGEYRKGHAFAEIHDVPAGRFTIVCSMFEQGQLGEFILKVGTMSDCTVQRIPTRPAGHFVSHPKTAFFAGEMDRLWAPLNCARLTRLSVVAQSHDTAGHGGGQAKSSGLPLRISLESGHGLTKRVLASSSDDDFSNGHYGVQLNDIDIQAHMCPKAGVRLVLERAGSLNPASQEGVNVKIYSTNSIDVGSWVG
ncbi:MAG: hypothetical protein Q9170_000453 [Blastenia crenularia]